MSLVQVIPAYNVLSDAKETVAAYCRVSSKSTNQLHSYRAQVSYYTNLISSNSNWELVDIYADKGITGTSIDKRDEFQRMMADCRAGKIKRILVKSVSRFARNSIELIEATRELKQLGVVVVFEEQGIDTSQMLGEMHLTMFAIAAQEESYSISKNMRWSYQKRMEQGSFISCYAPYGYQLKNGTLALNPSEAEVVREIFDLYLSGMGQREIVNILNSKNIPPRRGTKWMRSSIKYILSNERYTGDALLQKNFTTDTLPFTRKKNHGECPQYYIHGSHAPVISKIEFQKASTLANNRNRQISRSAHLFTHRILCPDCGRHFREIKSSGKSYWICPSRANKINPCRPYRFPESSITNAFLNLAGKLYVFKETILSPALGLLQEIVDRQLQGDQKLFELHNSLLELNDKLLVLRRLHTKGFIEENDYRRQNEQLASERQQLKEARKSRLDGSYAVAMREQIQILLEQINSWEDVPSNFDIALFDSIVSKITPCGDNALLFQLTCGLKFTEVISK